jgi:myosin heavy subunit
MLEAIRIRKAGFSIRIEFESLLKRYKPILKAYTKSTTKEGKEASKIILQTITAKQPNLKDTWQLGFTKAFMKEETR